MNFSVLRAALLMQLRLVGVVPATYVTAAAMPTIYLLLLARGLGGAALAETVNQVTLMGVWGGTVWNCGLTLRWDAMTGVLPAVSASPARMRDVMLGRCAGGVLFSLGAVLASVAAVLVCTRPTDSGMAWRCLVETGPTAAVCSIAAGFLLGSALIGSRSAFRIAELVLYLVLVFGGMMIPLDRLPRALRFAAPADPLYWIGRIAAPGGGPLGWRVPVSAAVSTLACALIADWWLRLALRRLRRTGRVEYV